MMRTPMREHLTEIAYPDPELGVAERKFREEVIEAKIELDTLAFCIDNNHPFDTKDQAQLLKELVDVQYSLCGLVNALGWTNIFSAGFTHVHDDNLSKHNGTYEEGRVEHNLEQIVKDYDIFKHLAKRGNK